MTTNTVKHTPDATDSIADDLLRNGYERLLRLEEEKAAIGDDLKELFAELKAQGFAPKALRESFRRVRNADNADQQEHDAIVDLYVASLTRARPARTREASYSEAKGRGDAVGNTDAIAGKVTGSYLLSTTPKASVSKASSVETVDLGTAAFDPETGELTDTQESGPAPSGSTSVPAESASDEISAQDDVGATASSTNSAHKPAGDLAADNGDKDRGSFPVGGPVHSHSPAAIPVGAANSAGGAPSSSPASPARHSDDIDLTIPAFLRRDEGRGYPKREAVEA